MDREFERVTVLLLDEAFNFRRADLPRGDAKNLRPLLGGKIKIQQQTGLSLSGNVNCIIPQRIVAVSSAFTR